MSTVKIYKRNTSPDEMVANRIAWLKEDNDRFIAFEIYSRDAKVKYLVTIRKSDLFTTCPCEDRRNKCWHMLLAMRSYLNRIQRGEVT